MHDISSILLSGDAQNPSNLFYEALGAERLFNVDTFMSTEACVSLNVATWSWAIAATSAEVASRTLKVFMLSRFYGGTGRSLPRIDFLRQSTPESLRLSKLRKAPRPGAVSRTLAHVASCWYLATKRPAHRRLGVGLACLSQAFVAVLTFFDF